MEGNSLFPNFYDLYFNVIFNYCLIPLKYREPDNTLEVYKHYYELAQARPSLREAIGTNIRNKASLDLWLRVSNITSLDLGLNFFDLDEFWLEALRLATEDFIKEQNDASKKVLKDIEAKMDSGPQHRSVFNEIPRPNMPNL